jgi:hypothetical protein
MVGRLIQKQNMWAGPGDLSEDDSAFLASREQVHRLKSQVAADTEAA